MQKDGLEHAEQVLSLRTDFFQAQVELEKTFREPGRPCIEEIDVTWSEIQVHLRIMASGPTT